MIITIIGLLFYILVKLLFGSAALILEPDYNSGEWAMTLFHGLVGKLAIVKNTKILQNHAPFPLHSDISVPYMNM
jgi:hypothetical protein